jgi:predicted transcriptional regulator
MDEDDRMGPNNPVAESQPEPVATTREADSAWAQSLRDVLREVIERLPDHATLGDLIAAATSNPQMAPVLDIFTVQELIDLARARPRPGKNGGSGKPGKSNGSRSAPAREIQFDEDGNPIMDLGEPGALVIRRRADVPDGDIRVLRCLSERGALRESDLVVLANLTSEQFRIILRHLRTKGFIHVEGSGLKRRLKITRMGNAFLRKQG